jgi:mono/diheme cytochrome c family protein
LRIITLFALAGSAVITLAAASPVDGEAVLAARKWILLVDSQKYAESWDAAGSQFRAKVKREQWVTALTRSRQPMGDLISRSGSRLEFSKTTAGGPDGDYALLNFTSRFGNQGVFTERVTLMKEDGCWQVAAYAILTAPGAGNAPTYDKEIAPILFKHCAQCHSSGEIASAVPLLTYEGARPWAKAIKEKVLLREMPPWPADPSASLKFRNDARLSQQDIDTLVAWVNAGAPKGDDRDLPAAPQQTPSWMHGGWMHPAGRPPDAVISLPGDFELPAKGEIPYIKMLAKVPFSEDKWVVAAEVRPGNGAVVHHMAITEVELADWVKPADLEAFARLGITNNSMLTRPAVIAPSHLSDYDMLGLYTPGTTFESYPDGTAKLLRGGKNLYLNFNIHYTTTGKPETDRSSIALWFQSSPPKQQLYRVPAAVQAIIAQGRELLTDAAGDKAEGTSVAIPPIPPNEENYEVIGMTAYTEPVTIYQLQPHAHLRGKDFQYTVVYPDGREQSILSVPKYDFHWQLAYDLETPLKLPAGSKLVVTAHYDNSLRNKSNPAPDREVYFRSQNQSSDEMFTPFVQYSIAEAPAQGPAAEKDPRVELAEIRGCLEQGPAQSWMLVNASDPVVSTTQATSSEALPAASSKPLGDRSYQLVGAHAFHPAAAKGQKVAVKGALIPDGKLNRLNVTSLQSLSASCSSSAIQKIKGPTE